MSPSALVMSLSGSVSASSDTFAHHRDASGADDADGGPPTRSRTDTPPRSPPRSHSRSTVEPDASGTRKPSMLTLPRSLPASLTLSSSVMRSGPENAYVSRSSLDLVRVDDDELSLPELLSFTSRTHRTDTTRGGE